MKNEILLSREFENFSGQSGVFISHSGDSCGYLEVKTCFEEKNINYLCDDTHHLRPGDPNYIATIKKMIKNANGGVLIVSPAALKSEWVMYEIGLLEGLEKNITLYIDDVNINNGSIPDIFKKYYIVNDLNELADIVSKYSIFWNLFEHETRQIKSADFKNAIIGKLENLRLRIPLASTSEIDMTKIQFGYIVIRMAKAGELSGDNKLCLVTREKRTGNLCIAKEECGIGCVFLNDIYCEDVLESIVLNTILFYSKVDNDEVEYIVPFHNTYGLTFKCFVDLKDPTMKTAMEKLLIASNMEDVSSSDSGENQRIYFLLPEMKKSGLFQIRSPEGILNNFLCPGIEIK